MTGGRGQAPFLSLFYVPLNREYYTPNRRQPNDRGCLNGETRREQFTLFFLLYSKVESFRLPSELSSLLLQLRSPEKMASKSLILHPTRTSPLPSTQRPCFCSRHNTSALPTITSKPQPFPLRIRDQAITSSPLVFHQNPNSIRSVTVRSQLSFPLVSPTDQWGNWTALFAIGAFGIW